MKAVLIVAAIGTLAIGGNASAQSSGPECAAIDDGAARLTCYDSVFRTTTATPVIAGKGAWKVSTETSKITDRTNVYLNVDSDQDIPDRFGGGGTPATLVIRCLDNTTSFTIYFGGQFMASSGGYDRVTYRIDKQPAVQDRWDESTDNKHMGLWNGGQAIPMIKSLFGAENLLVQATPFNESSLTVDFKVGGLEEAIKPLREACAW